MSDPTDHAPDGPSGSRPKAHRPRASIEDDYPEYVTQTRGYQYDALELLAPEPRRRHDELRRAGPERLDALDLEALEDFERLAVAHAWREAGEGERAREALESILERAPYHASVALDEVFAWTLELHLAAGRPEDAEALWARAEGWAPEWPQLELLAAKIAHAREDLERREALLLEYALADERDEPERRYEVTAWLLEVGAEEEAQRRWLEAARAAARREGDEELVVDLALLERQIR